MDQTATPEAVATPVLDVLAGSSCASPSTPANSFTRTEPLDRMGHWDLFRQETQYGMALLRILLSLVLLQGALQRWSYVEELFSTNGVPVELAVLYGYTNYLIALPPVWSASLYTLLILTLVTAAVGWKTRISLAIAFLLHTYFALTDAATSMTKFTVIQVHVLLLLTCSGCGKIWSVDAWLARRRAAQAGLPAPSTASPLWPVVMLHVLLGFSYFGAAITKLHIPDFFTGDPLVYWILSNPHSRYSVGEWLTQHPALLAVSSHITVVWEVTFLFICWRGWQRYGTLIIGMGFHLMAIFTLGEVIFFLVMFSVYLGLLREAEYRTAWNWIQPWFANWSRGNQATRFEQQVSSWTRWLLNERLAWSGYVGGLLVLSLAGGWWNYARDPMHVRNPEGKLALREMTQEEIDALFQGTSAVREVDKFLSFNAGTTLISGKLTDRRNNYRVGEIAVCEVSLNPPHEDMFVECHLCDEDGILITREATVVAREIKTVHFRYNLTHALVPGKYQLVLRSRGQNIETRDFELLPALSAPVAN